MKKETWDTGIVFDIDHFAVHDGPGIRTCIYFKGCPLRCKWCHSPESQSIKPQILFAANRCIKCGACVRECRSKRDNYNAFPDLCGCQGGQTGDRYGCQYSKENGERQFLYEKCAGCGDCVSVCPTGALFLSGKMMHIEEIVNEVLPDKVYFKNSGGGVTLSGGEVLMQAEFAAGILRRLKEEGIHTIVETSGYGDRDDLLMLAESADIFYYDYKLSDKNQFSYYTGGNLDIVLNNLKSLCEITDAVVLRIPLIPGITDTKDNITTAYQTAQQLHIREIHLLPYNAAAGAKYEWCGKTYELGEMQSDTDHNEQLKSMAPKELNVRIMY